MLFQEISLLNNYLKQGQGKVKGWLAKEAILLITRIDEAQKIFDIKGHVGEIGVFNGKLFIILYLLVRTNEQAVAVDIFAEEYLNVYQSSQGYRDIFIKNVENFAKSTEKLKVIAEDSSKISANDIKISVGGELRLFSVDGGHTANLVRNDLKIASQSICKGGVIILDDYFNPAWPGVSEGTNQFFIYDNSNSNIVPFAIGGGKVFFSHSIYADRYIEYLLKCNIGDLIYNEERELFGNRVICFASLPLTIRSILAKTPIWKKIKDKSLGKFLKQRL
jgi:hypothetical protein